MVLPILATTAAKLYQFNQCIAFFITSLGYSPIPKNKGYCVGSGCIPIAIWCAMSGPVKRNYLYTILL